MSDITYPHSMGFSSYDDVVYYLEEKWHKGGGDAGLPEVTSEDNGDVLTVVDGAWAKAAPSGGGVMIVHMNDDTGVIDTTWQEIHDAMVSGKIVVLPGGEIGGNESYTNFIMGADYLFLNDSYSIWLVGQHIGIDDPFASTDSADGYPVHTDSQ